MISAKNWKTLFWEMHDGKNTSVSLGDRFADLMDSKAQSGRYGSASDVVRAGLRLLKKHETNVKALQDGFDRGRAVGRAATF